MSKIRWLDWSKAANQFSVNSCGKFLCRSVGSPFSLLSVLGDYGC